MTEGPELSQEIAEMKARVLASLPDAESLSHITFRVSPKGGLAIHGMRSLPIVLYKNEWTLLLFLSEQIKGFIRATPELVDKSFQIAEKKPERLFSEDDLPF